VKAKFLQMLLDPKAGDEIIEIDGTEVLTIKKNAMIAAGADTTVKVVYTRQGKQQTATPHGKAS
jgi:C-terminal processing protease CtpA/Prc